MAQDADFKFSVYDVKVDLERAQHPSDIKFENREISETGFKIRKWIYITGVVIFCVIFFFLCTFLVQNMQIIGFMQQPPMNNCEVTRAKYDEEALFSLAFQEYYQLKENKQAKNLNMNTVISRNGALYCFCKNEMDNNAATDRFSDYTFYYTDHYG